uniref:BAALC binder of MAP3K1 and KLF4 n=1 Tax=Microcebus murinus TaxID=30608 RepID=A0A8C5XQ66_MICMU
MGCGGSRADAIEPRYYESWTRETESTWLTYTDSDTPPSAAGPDSGPEAGGLHAACYPFAFALSKALLDQGLLR